MIEAVIFDCDGVLVDSERINNEVLAELVTCAGLPTTYQDCIARYMGRSTAECVAEVERALGYAVSFDLASEYERRVLLRQQDELEPVPGVRELLDHLHEAAMPVCVASSGTPGEIKARLDATGLAGYFDNRCFSATMVDHGKPAPDLFLLAARRLGVPPARCLVIEDSPYGVKGAKAAGMTVLGYASLAADEALMAAGAERVIHSMADVVTLTDHF
ncbi:HAD family hydrolase [Krasilnikovia sp. MM14-A1259]|uniref:HAD family hydrolase n=1 Tax=Krasilnikovia sp. MM14-A1259 TaxID=3373539 RepID=UPI0038093C5F